ncbi:alpha/beta hydrolase [Paenibacillus sp. LHD-117]|uniref:alpha/beta fold hydrolase n=1 Tax=Paenibacillus sp. LHD-117 TaxID=3071412 RepID=UPI0027E172C2|nr:alpha/beta hydrolase [Paenibacillus sp. LHD-117]MDQ6420897.1 alpha/beta hydrolase [Paenibacillus sp. LHD-117]
MNHLCAMNNNVTIHYLDSGGESCLTPLLICPGLSETAEEYEEFVAFLQPRRCVVLSFRGRGKSGTPEAGYGLEAHIADIEAVVKEAGLERFHLFAYSRGVSYALGYLERHESQVVTVLLQDYPPEHKQMTVDWAESYIHDYLIPYERLSNIRAEAVRGIQRESVQREFGFAIKQPLLIMRGLLEGSLVDDEHVLRYRSMGAHVEVREFEQSGHDIRSTEKLVMFETVRSFIDRHDHHAYEAGNLTYT